MNLETQIQSTTNPQEALLVLARGLDELIAVLRERPEPEPDGWGEWDRPEVHEQIIATADPRRSKVVATEEWEQGITAATEAVIAAEQRSKVVTSEDGDVTVELPVVSTETMVERGDFATQLQLDANVGPGSEDAYVKGGPLWLYYSNRDFVMQLSTTQKRIMVNDVMETSPEEAKEMGRDIFKSNDPGERGVGDFVG